MIDLHPQYIKDSDGNNLLVVLRLVEFEHLIEALNDVEDIRIYDEAKLNDNGERIGMTEAFKNLQNGEA